MAKAIIWCERCNKQITATRWRDMSGRVAIPAWEVQFHCHGEDGEHWIDKHRLEAARADPVTVRVFQPVENPPK